jgi:hypothetical protein
MLVSLAPDEQRLLRLCPANTYSIALTRNKHAIEA